MSKGLYWASVCVPGGRRVHMRARHDVDHGLDGEDPRARGGGPRRRGPGQRGADELALEFVGAAGGTRVHERVVAARPGEVRDLVHRADQGRPAGLLQVQPREGAA
jgi:hypothetical protein